MGLLRRLAQNGPPPGFSIPPGVNGPPPGFTPPPGMTGPPPWLHVSSTQISATATRAGASASSVVTSILTGPPAGTSVPADMTGPPMIPTNGEISPNISNEFDISHHGPPVGLNDQNRKILVGVATMMLVLCVAAVNGRLASRRITKQRLGSDDYFAIFALVLFMGLAADQYCLAHYFAFAGIPSLEKFHVLGRLKFTSQLIYGFVMFAARLSILLLYKRVFNLRTLWFRIAWWFSISIVTVYTLVLSIANITQCLPHAPSMVWEDPLLCQKYEFARLSPATMGFLNAAIDLTILVLPTRMTWELQMSRKQKWAISSVFGLGLIGVAVSLARAITLRSPNLFRQGIIVLAVWSTTECAVALICACLPVMRPLFTFISKTLSIRSWTRLSSSSSSPSSKKNGWDRKGRNGSGGSEKSLTNQSSGMGRGYPSGRGMTDDNFGSGEKGYGKVETRIEVKSFFDCPPSSGSSASPLSGVNPTRFRDDGVYKHARAIDGDERSSASAQRGVRSDSILTNAETMGSQTHERRNCRSIHFCSMCRGEVERRSERLRH